MQNGDEVDLLGTDLSVPYDVTIPLCVTLRGAGAFLIKSTT